MDCKKNGIKQWAVGNQLPIFNGTRSALIEIFGNNRVLIENHRGVIVYTKELVRVSSTDGTISVKGTELLLECMSRFQLVITGSIYEVSLGYGR